MATTTTTETLTETRPPLRTKRVCFSFAAYAKTLIHHFKSLDIPILPGLNDAEFKDLESTFNFSFPPDLRSILREGLPVGPSFPNWRSSSRQQLQLLLSLPRLSLSRNVSFNNFWSDSWGQKPQDKNHALRLVKDLMDKAPVLVPIYRNCYIPSAPNLAGNPVFYIDTEEVKVLSYDLSGFFKEVDFFQAAAGGSVGRGGVLKPLVTPAWAAKEARMIEFWTDVAERGKRLVGRGDTRGWWNAGGGGEIGLGLDYCLEEVFWRLRDGGWREDEVREMMMMNGGDDDQNANSGVQIAGNYRERVAWQTRVLSLVLLRAGWSRDDVVYSLNLDEDRKYCNGGDVPEGKFQHPTSSKCAKEEDNRKKGSSSINQFIIS